MVLLWIRRFGVGELGLEEVVGRPECRVGDRFGSTLRAVQSVERVGWSILWTGCRQDAVVACGERLCAPSAGCCSWELSANEQLGDVSADLTMHQTITSLSVR